MEDASVQSELAATARRIRAAFREAQELAEEAAEQLARKERTLAEVLVDAMHGGRRVHLHCGCASFSGVVAHVGDDVVVLDDVSGGQVDLWLEALTELALDPPQPGLGRPRTSVLPRCFADCLEGLEATGRVVELGGPALAPQRVRVEVVAADHLVISAGGLERVLARAAVGFVLRR